MQMQDFQLRLLMRASLIGFIAGFAAVVVTMLLG